MQSDSCTDKTEMNIVLYYKKELIVMYCVICSVLKRITKEKCNK